MRFEKFQEKILQRANKKYLTAYPLTMDEFFTHVDFDNVRKAHLVYEHKKEELGKEKALKKVYKQFILPNLNTLTIDLDDLESTVSDSSQKRYPAIDLDAVRVGLVGRDSLLLADLIETSLIANTNTPYIRPFDETDMVKIFYIPLFNSSGVSTGITVLTEEYINSDVFPWTEEELEQAVYENLEESVICSPFKTENLSNMLTVITGSEDNVFGASAILSYTIIQKLINLYPTGFYIIPSDINTVLAVDKNIPPEILNKLYEDLNAPLVPSKNQLSKKIYEFDFYSSHFVEMPSQNHLRQDEKENEEINSDAETEIEF